MLIRKRKILTKLIDYLAGETGISLALQDVKLKITRKTLHVLVYGIRFGSREISRREIKGCSVEDIAILVIEKAGDVKQALVELKIAQLQRSLPGIISELRLKLTGRINQPILDSLKYVIEDRGYDYTHCKAEQEAERGFPVILLHIFNTNGLRVDFPLNIHFPANPVEDAESLADKIIVAAR